MPQLLAIFRTVKCTLRPYSVLSCIRLNVDENITKLSLTRLSHFTNDKNGPCSSCENLALILGH